MTSAFVTACAEQAQQAGRFVAVAVTESAWYEGFVTQADAASDEPTALPLVPATDHVQQ
jgi:hypothetical protein